MPLSHRQLAARVDPQRLFLAVRHQRDELVGHLGVCAPALGDGVRGLRDALERTAASDVVRDLAEEGRDAADVETDLDLRRPRARLVDVGRQVAVGRRAVAVVALRHRRADLGGAVVGVAVLGCVGAHARQVALCEIPGGCESRRVGGVLEVPPLVERVRPVHHDEHEDEERRDDRGEEDEHLAAVVAKAEAARLSWSSHCPAQPCKCVGGSAGCSRRIVAVAFSSTDPTWTNPRRLNGIHS